MTLFTRFGMAALGAGLLLMAYSQAIGAPGDSRVVRGTVEWPTTAETTPFIVVRGDDGRRYSADVSTAQRGQVALTAGTRVTLSGVEGNRPHEIVAVSVVPESAPAPSPTPPAPSSRAPASEPPPQRLDGRVQGVSGSMVVLMTDDGRRVVVDLSSLGPRTDDLRAGDEVTVFGRHVDRRFVASGFIWVEEPTGSALPRQRR